MEAGLMQLHLSFPHGTSDCQAGLTQPLRFTASFPWSPRQSTTRKPYSSTAIFVIRGPSVSELPQSLIQQKPLLRVAFLLRSALVIPAVWEIVAMMHKVSKSCESFLTCAYTTLTMSTIFPLLFLLIIVRVVNTLHKGFAVVNLDK